ncbi:ATP-binding protein [Streptomyces sp. NPDC127068]|uniref:ATP-binding protein n=1 Tax=Streptomyces sp. NPDC127068 TaxID=3347127 RepID=UPI0036582639
MTQGRPDAAGARKLWERDRELDAAREAIADLCRDRPATVPGVPEPPGHLLVFTGEPGIGKTALLDAIRRTAQNAGCVVWSARSGETLTSVPFHVVRQLIQPALITLTPDEARGHLDEWYGIAGPALGIAEPSESLVDPQAVFDGLVHVVGNLAKEHFPLVLLIDDAQWADPETLRWLADLAEHLDESRVLVVVAHRTLDPGHDAAPYLSRIGQAAQLDSVLHRFTPEAAAQLTRATLGAHADDPFCRQVWAVTGGNPYDTVELLAKVEDRAMQPTESSADALRGLNKAARDGGLISRLDALGVETARFARAAAILGTDIPLPVVARLARVTEDVAHGRVAELRAARILAEPEAVPATGSDGLEFVHPLIASAVYQSIRPATRTTMHGLAARVVLDTGGSPTAVARHLLEVHPDDDPELVEQLRAAARESLAVGAPEAAVRCLERALREPPPPEFQGHVLYELGCATLLTAPARTVAHLREALAVPGFSGDDRVDAVCRLAQALVHNDELKEAVRVIDQEAGHLEPGPQRLRLQALRYMWEGIHAEKVNSSTRSESLAALVTPLTGRDNTERALLIIRAFDAMTRGESAEAVVELCDRSLVNGVLPAGLGWTDTEWGFELLMMLGSSYLFTDRLDRAESLFSEALRVYQSRGWSGGHLALAHAFVGFVLRRRGKLADAEGLLREGLRLADRVGSGLPMHWDAACMLIDTLVARGHLDQAMEVVDQYGITPPYPSTIIMPDAHAVRGRLLIETGRVAEGVRALEAAEKSAAVGGRHNTVMAPWAADLARALVRKDPARAAELAAVARAQAERIGTDTAMGEALRCAAALETGQRSVTLYAQAVAYLEASPCAYEHAVARIDYGIAARSAAEVNRGLTLARSCGADGLVVRGEAALAAWRKRD